jgi:hypothetical protein
MAVQIIWERDYIRLHEQKKPFLLLRFLPCRLRSGWLTDRYRRKSQTLCFVYSARAVYLVERGFRCIYPPDYNCDCDSSLVVSLFSPFDFLSISNVFSYISFRICIQQLAHLFSASNLFIYLI